MEGKKLVAPLAAWLGDSARAVWEHHERIDGTGYPQGLKGNQISLAARVVSVADVYDVMTSVRSYKELSSAAEAREELARCAGTQFDPDAVKAFLAVSMSRVRSTMGPLSWFTQLSMFPQAVFAQVGPTLATTAVVATGAAAGTVGIAVSPAALAVADEPTAVAVARYEGDQQLDLLKPRETVVVVESDSTGTIADAPQSDDLADDDAARPDASLAEDPAPDKQPDGEPPPTTAARPGAATPTSTVPSATSVPTTSVPVSTAPPRQDSTTTSVANPPPASGGNGSGGNGDGNNGNGKGNSGTPPGQTTTTTTTTTTLPPATTSTTTTSTTTTSTTTTSTTTTSTTTTTTTPVPPVDFSAPLYLGTSGADNTTSSAQLPLSTTAPTVWWLYNYDTDRDAAPGLLVKKDSNGLAGGDPTKVQIFSQTFEVPTHIHANAKATLYVAAKDFNSKDISVAASLVHCTAAGSCTTVATGDKNKNNLWKFKTVKVKFGVVDITFAAGDRLELRVAALDASEDDMYLAYGTTEQSSVLSFDTDLDDD